MGKAGKKEFEKMMKDPPEKYRGAPFWSWNGKLDRDRMKEQIDDFKKMGFGGFHIHSRIGLADEYLGEKFLKDVKFCQAYAAEKGMYTYLYDEDKWPSGYGGGRVTKEEKYRARYLLFSPVYRENGHCDRHLAPTNRLTENGDLTLLKVYRIRLKEGLLAEYEVLDTVPEYSEERKSSVQGYGEMIWYAYRIVTDPLPWFNNEAYADTLNPEATEKFLEVSYEPYAGILGDEFSRTVPSIFTDEPQFTRMQSMKSARIPGETGIPYTDRLDVLYRERYGEGLLEKLPEIFWPDESGVISCVRYRYMNLLADQFAESYTGVLSGWCGKHNIMLAGHLMEENGLENQIRSVGDTMRSYARFQFPGIDMLADAREYTTAKQAQSIVHQLGKPGMLSELYGVTNWNFDFRGHKLQGDWQAALGVTLRVPHLSWMYMGGESKRDYPAPIDSHSPWYREYALIEDYFSRVNLFLDYGAPCVTVGVIHPIESMFMELGTLDETAEKRMEMEKQFQELTEWLLFGLIDFDFISEALIPEIAGGQEGKVGKMSYRVILVPELTTIRKTTLDFLESFRKNGGTVIVLGSYPEYMDGERSEEPQKRLGGYIRLGYEEQRILRTLEPARVVDIRDESNLRSRDLLCQIRTDGENMRIFAAHGKLPEYWSRSVDPGQKSRSRYRMYVKGGYDIVKYDGFSGKADSLNCWREGPNTCVNLEIYGHDSLLLELRKCDDEKEKNAECMTTENMSDKCLILEEYLPSETEWHTEEPNVLLLDMAEYSVDGGEIMPREEILKIDDRIREQLGYRKRTDSFPQPWLTREGNRKEHMVYLRFTVQSEISCRGVKLAFEGEDDCRIRWNGVSVENVKTGEYYVDRAIRTLRIPEIQKGKNILECEIPFGNLTNLEWFYLLGSFGVRVNGSRTVLEREPEKIGFGDYAVQGFPFYGGNFVYESDVELPEGELEIQTEDYQGALLEIQVDDNRPLPVFMEPYITEPVHIKAGKHRIRIRCFGTRINTFGQMHNCKKGEIYFGPRTWRTEGNDWCYEYRLHPCGVLKAPVLRVFRKK